MRLLQTYLNTLATVYPEIGTLAVDGIFGEATENAVKTVQRIFGLPETGVVNLATWNVIAGQYESILTGRTRSEGQWSE